MLSEKLHELNEAEELARKIGKLKLGFVLETGETGKAFGSVTAKDIEDKLRSEANIELDRHRIQLDRPIKESGEQEVPIRLHATVIADFKAGHQSTHRGLSQRGRGNNRRKGPAETQDKIHWVIPNGERFSRFNQTC